MESGPFRQEVINVVLAQELTERGLTASPEVFLQRAAVDVLASFRGLRLAIEGEVDDQPGAAERAWRKARERVERGLAHVGLAVVYPSRLRHLSLADLPRGIAEGRLRFSFCLRISPTPPAWQEGDLAFLRAALDEAFRHLSSENEVRAAAKLLTNCIEELAREMFSEAAAVRRAAAPLGVPWGDNGQYVQVAKIAALVIANALLFQEELAKVNENIKTLRQCLEALSPQDELLTTWRFILKEINYHAVFDVAAQILLGLPADRRLDHALRRACLRVIEVARMQVALEHDVTGRLYHLLLGTIAKPLGTFYTSVSAAILLLRLALDPARWSIGWDDVEEVAGLRIGDLACGTGTLLATATQALVDNVLRISAQQGTLGGLDSRRRQLLESLLENSIWGLDVLPSATHLTATTLALPVPEVMAKGMRLYSLDLGVRKAKPLLGSLDLLEEAPLTASLSMFPTRRRTRGRRATTPAPTRTLVPLPAEFDLLCMNPPFTRTCGDNLLFGSMPAEQRRLLQVSLARLVKEKKVSASITAGLGSVFLAVADRRLRIKGRLAFVLPKAMLSGVDWEPTRKLLRDYTLEAVIASHDPHRWNFSENTDLSEVLLVARKGTARGSEGDTLCVNLWSNADVPLSALEITEQLRVKGAAPLSQGATALRVGDEKVGEAFTIPWPELREMSHWLFPFAFAQSELVRLALALCGGRLTVGSKTYSVPLCPLHYLATIGPDRRRIWATFAVTDREPGFPAFWGHDAAVVNSLVQRPNAYLTKLARPKEKQRAGYADTLMQQSGNVLIAERMRLNTQNTPAMLTTERVLSNVWWPAKLRNHLTDDAAKALILWINSTLGLLIFLSFRAETEGAFVDFKKPTLQSMPVLDLAALGSTDLQKLAHEFDRIAQGTMQPLREIASDEARKRIDDVLCQVLRLPDLTDLRHRLSTEPILSASPLSSKFLSDPH